MDISEQGKKCPGCNDDIGLWAIVKAPLPNKIKCPHCKTKIEYENTGWWLVVVSTIIYISVICIVAYQVEFAFTTKRYILSTLSALQLGLIIFVICMTLGLLVEFVIASYLRSNKKLIIQKKA